MLASAVFRARMDQFRSPRAMYLPKARRVQTVPCDAVQVFVFMHVAVSKTLHTF